MQLVGGGLLLALVLSAIGWGIVRMIDSRPLMEWEGSASSWVLDHRTPLLDGVWHVGSALSDTVACIVLLVLMIAAARLWLGRWREVAALAARRVPAHVEAFRRDTRPRR